MGPITPCLWFDGNAEEAVRFYCTLFPDAEVTHVVRAPAGGPRPAGGVIALNFRLAGRDFQAINGNSQFQFSEAVSFSVPCDTQAEIDALWDRLVEGGTPMRCGWLKDRYGLAWQVVPATLGRLMTQIRPGRDGACHGGVHDDDQVRHRGPRSRRRGLKWRSHIELRE